MAPSYWKLYDIYKKWERTETVSRKISRRTGPFASRSVFGAPGERPGK